MTAESRRSAASQHHRAARAFRGTDEGRHRASVAAPVNRVNITLLEQLTLNIGAVFNTIEATMRTEGLLKQSQQLTVELQSRQAELQHTNEELAPRRSCSPSKTCEVERKNTEVEQARHALEEKAAELALTSKYKSEFLANMSHELRTPLNSILILGQQLADNATGNLSGSRSSFRGTSIRPAPTPDAHQRILDLSKIESGHSHRGRRRDLIRRLARDVDRNFRHVAEAKNLALHMSEFDANLPRRLTTDPNACSKFSRIWSSNAVKFTSQGSVTMHVSDGAEGWSPDHPCSAPPVSDFACDQDTGIGVAPGEAADDFRGVPASRCGTSRKFGGTGLGLAISRELAMLLGGEIRSASVHGTGQHVHAVLASALYRPSSATARPRSTAVRSPSLARPLPVMREATIPDDRDDIHEGDPGSVDRRGRSALCPRSCLGLRATKA